MKQFTVRIQSIFNKIRHSPDPVESKSNAHLCFVYKFLIWYVFGIFLSDGLVEILNQFIWFITRRKQRNW